MAVRPWTHEKRNPSTAITNVVFSISDKERKSESIAISPFSKLGWP